MELAATELIVFTEQGHISQLDIIQKPWKDAMGKIVQIKHAAYFQIWLILVFWRINKS